MAARKRRAFNINLNNGTSFKSETIKDYITS